MENISVRPQEYLGLFTILAVLTLPTAIYIAFTLGSMVEHKRLGLPINKKVIHEQSVGYVKSIFLPHNRKK